MQISILLAASFLALASAQNVENPKPAKAVMDNPLGMKYSATFDGKKGVEGTVTFIAGPKGAGVDIKVDLAGFEGEPGPFGYHIHDQPVPEDGNCTGTKAHLDPNGRGQVTPCDVSDLSSCEVGDLAGKHGKIPAPKDGPVKFSAAYNDLYASTKEGIGAFLGNRSIVIHRADDAKSRLACANIVLVQKRGDPSFTTPSTPSGTGQPGSPGNNETMPTRPSEPSDVPGSAAAFGLPSALAVGSLIAGLFMAM